MHVPEAFGGAGSLILAPIGADDGGVCAFPSLRAPGPPGALGFRLSTMPRLPVLSLQPQVHCSRVGAFRSHRPPPLGARPPSANVSTHDPLSSISYSLSGSCIVLTSS